MCAFGLKHSHERSILCCRRQIKYFIAVEDERNIYVTSAEHEKHIWSGFSKEHITVVEFIAVSSVWVHLEIKKENSCNWVYCSIKWLSSPWDEKRKFMKCVMNKYFK